MLNRFKSIFRLSDIFLVCWLLFGILLFLEQYRFIYYSSADLLEFSKPFFIFVIYFVLMISSLILYLIFELKNQKTKTNIALLFLLFFIIISQLESILLSPNNITLYLLSTRGDDFLVSATFNTQVKLIHFFTAVFIITTIFIGVFIFSKRFNNIKVVSYAIYVLYLLALVSFIYSLIHDDYITLFKILTLIERPTLPLKWYCPESFYGNPNTYGMLLEVCFYLSFVNYMLTKKRFNIVLGFILYIHLLITICRGAIIATSIIIPVILLLTALLAFRKKEKKKAVFFMVSFTLFVSIVTGGYLLLTSSDKFSFIFSNMSPLAARKSIWYSCLQIISNGSILHGYGYGIYNSLVANACNYYGYTNCPISHNWFLALMGEGGLFYIIPYICLLGYSTFIIVKKMPNDRLMIPVSFAVYGFFIHSFFEDNYYILIGLIVMVLVINHIDKENKVVSNN